MFVSIPNFVFVILYLFSLKESPKLCNFQALGNLEPTMDPDLYHINKIPS